MTALPTACLCSKASPPNQKVESSPVRTDRQTDSLRLLTSCGVEPSGSTETGVASSGRQNLKAAPCSTDSLQTRPPHPLKDAACPLCPLCVRPQHALCRSKESQGLERKWVLREAPILFFLEKSPSCFSPSQALRRGSRAGNLQLSLLELCLGSLGVQRAHRLAGEQRLLAFF